MTALPRIMAVVGPTASGKTTVGIELAKKNNGAVLSADSRQIYTDMDIGTAKPEAVHGHPTHATTEPEMIDGVPHYFFNARQPNQPYDVATWQRDAFFVIDALLQQGRTPLLVGGTMLYIDCLAFNYAIPAVPPLPDLRQELDKQPVRSLYEQLIRQDPHAANFIQASNKRRIIRALEVMAATGQPFSAQRLQHNPKYNVEWVGLFPGWEQLETQIAQRITAMITAGLLTETQQLQAQYGPDLPLLQTLNYRQAAQVLSGDLPQPELPPVLTKANIRYARRQISWWRNNQDITWYASAADMMADKPALNALDPGAHLSITPPVVYSRGADTSSR